MGLKARGRTLLTYKKYYGTLPLKAALNSGEDSVSFRDARMTML